MIISLIFYLLLSITKFFLIINVATCYRYKTSPLTEDRCVAHRIPNGVCVQSYVILEPLFNTLLNPRPLNHELWNYVILNKRTKHQLKILCLCTCLVIDDDRNGRAGRPNSPCLRTYEGNQFPWDKKVSMFGWITTSGQIPESFFEAHGQVVWRNWRHFISYLAVLLIDGNCCSVIIFNMLRLTFISHFYLPINVIKGKNFGLRDSEEGKRQT